jgi:hypothetical protein
MEGGPSVEAAVLDRVIRVTSVAALIAVTPSTNTTIENLGYYTPGDGGGGTLFWSATTPKNKHNGGTVFSPTVPFGSSLPDYLSGTGETDTGGSGCFVKLHSQKMYLTEWGGTSTDNTTWDDALDAMTEYLEDEFGGGVVLLPEVDVYIYRAHVFLRAILIDGGSPGIGFETNTPPNPNLLGIRKPTVYVADGITAFQWGNAVVGDNSTRTNLFGGGLVGVVAKGLNHVRGNFAALYGSVNANIGVPTLGVTTGGAKNSAGDANSTTRLVYCAGGYAPIKFSDNWVEGFGTAFDISGIYGMTVENNYVRWCTFGVYLGNTWPLTTVSIERNTIERCAIGVFLDFPCSRVFIKNNVIQANYAGHDIAGFNSPEDLLIDQNYFEASPSSIFLTGEGTFLAKRVQILRNTGTSLTIQGPFVEDYTVEGNWLLSVDLIVFVGGTMRNVMFKDNTDGNNRSEGFDFNNITLNATAANFLHEIHIIDSGKVKRLGDTDGQVTSQLAKNQNVFCVQRDGTTAGFTIEVPNLALNLTAKVKVMSYRTGQDWQSNFAEYVIGIERAIDSDTVFNTVRLSETALATGASAITPPRLNPAGTITGASGEDQELNIDFGVAGPGGSSLFYYFDVEYISTLSGIVLK